MKQQGLGLLYCLSVVYGLVFSFNYHTKLNSNRHLEGSSEYMHMRAHAHTHTHTHKPYILHIQTHLTNHSRARVYAANMQQGFHLVFSRDRVVFFCCGYMFVSVFLSWLAFLRTFSVQVYLLKKHRRSQRSSKCRIQQAPFMLGHQESCPNQEWPFSHELNHKDLA